MSQENVEVVRRGLAAWNAGDMETFRELNAPDVIVRTLEEWPEPGPHVGRETVMRFFDQLRQTWDADTVEWVGEPIAAADRVVIRIIWHGAGHGPQAKMEMTCIYTVRKGRIRGWEYFWDHAEALEAVGLSEQDARADP
jgi:ketosteroid isomerase-like protein